MVVLPKETWRTQREMSLLDSRRARRAWNLWGPVYLRVDLWDDLGEE